MDKGNKIARIYAVVAVAMVVFQLLNTQTFIFGVMAEQNVHLMFSLVVVALALWTKNPRRWLLYLIIIGLVCVAGLYMQFQIDPLQERMGFPTATDVFFGVILISLVIVVSIWSMGWMLPVTVMLAIIYAFFAYLLPPPFTSMQLSLAKWVGRFSMLQGIYGPFLGMSTSYLFLFIVFGNVLQVCGATRFFEELARLIGSIIRGGPAMAAVVGSCLMGMVTGSVGANISTVGSFTIPLMKKVGYTPEQAGGIEAAGSTGGQIMPPVMGAAAFLMAGVLGVPYVTIMISGFIPALLYYLNLGLYIFFQAGRLNIALPTQNKEKVNWAKMFYTAPFFILPLAILIIGLIMGYSPGMVVFWTIVILVATSFMQKKKTRPTLSALVKGFTDGAYAATQVAVVIAIIGIMVTVITATGLGITLPGTISDLSGNNLVLTLFLIMVVALILGTALPTAAVYILMAITTAPVLVRMGVDPLVSHFFVFYYGCLSWITPPLAVGSMIGSKIAGGSPIKTDLESMKAGFAGFIVPFLFVFAPWLLLVGKTPVWVGLCQIVASFALMIGFQATFVGFYLTKTSLIDRGFLSAVAVLALLFIVQLQWWLFGLMFAALMIVTLIQASKRHQLVGSELDARGRFL